MIRYSSEAREHEYNIRKRDMLILEAIAKMQVWIRVIFYVMQTYDAIRTMSSTDKANNENNHVQKKQQIPTEYNEEETLRVLRKQK